MKKNKDKINSKQKTKKRLFSGYEFTLRQRHYLFWKRFIDICGAVVGIIVFIPVFIIIPIIIKCSSKGPVFYLQERIGKNKKIFKIVKFRSMKVGAPEIPPSELSIEQQKAMEYKWGNFMRKTSLDEIPQLFNILVGQMSFIGPRPGARKNEEELENFRSSLTPSAYDVHPGLGGYAQVKMKRDHDPELKAKLDSEYVKVLNFWLDFKLFFQTIFGVFGKNKGR